MSTFQSHSKWVTWTSMTDGRRDGSSHLFISPRLGHVQPQRQWLITPRNEALPSAPCTYSSVIDIQWCAACLSDSPPTRPFRAPYPEMDAPYVRLIPLIEPLTVRTQEGASHRSKFVKSEPKCTYAWHCCILCIFYDSVNIAQPYKLIGA